MKSFLGRLAVALAVLLAAGCALYPFASDQYARSQAAPLMDAYQRQAGALSDGQRDALLSSWQAYNRQLAEAERPSEAPGTVEGLLGILEIPRVGVRLPIYSAGEGQDLSDGVAHASRSALPTGEEGTHCVLAGANGLPARTGNEWIDPWLEKFNVLKAQLLHPLERVQAGDLIYLYTPLGAQVYRVAEMEEAQAGQMSLSSGGDGPARLTVMTNLGSRRLLAQGERVTLPQVIPQLKATDHTAVPSEGLSILLLGSPVLLVGLVWMLLVELIRRRHYRLPADSKKWLKAEE